MAFVEDDRIKIKIPFAVPFLGIHEPTTLNLNKATFQFVLRLVVCFCAFLLFWPRVVRTWRAATGTDDEARQKEINERIAKMEKERDATIAAGKKYAVVGETATTKTGSDMGSAKKRKT